MAILQQAITTPLPSDSPAVTPPSGFGSGMPAQNPSGQPAELNTGWDAEFALQLSLLLNGEFGVEFEQQLQGQHSGQTVSEEDSDADPDAVFSIVVENGVIVQRQLARPTNGASSLPATKSGEDKDKKGVQADGVQTEAQRSSTRPRPQEARPSSVFATSKRRTTPP